MKQSSRNSIIIHAPVEEVFRAFTEPTALESWLAPGDMTARVHDFDHREGGGYTMSLFYPEKENEFRGKTSGNEDRFYAKFVTLAPPFKIIQAIKFDSSKDDLKGEMIMEVTLTPLNKGTAVTIAFSNIPRGINPADNHAGTQS